MNPANPAQAGFAFFAAKKQPTKFLVYTFAFFL